MAIAEATRARRKAERAARAPPVFRRSAVSRAVEGAKAAMGFLPLGPKAVPYKALPRPPGGHGRGESARSKAYGMELGRFWTSSARAVALLALGLGSGQARAGTLEAHSDVRGAGVLVADVRSSGGPWRSSEWDALAQSTRQSGNYEVRLRFSAVGSDAAVVVPTCAGRGDVRIDGHRVSGAPGPLVVAVAEGRHQLDLDVHVTPYESRIACGDRARVGPAIRTIEGLGLLRFASPVAALGGGQAVVFVPPGHDVHRPGALLVGAHPWNGSVWSYAAYAELMREARARDLLLLMPSGLGNSLYTADAEQEVLRAIDALSAAIAIDARAVSIWGASMGGAGATTIGFHNPDRFATVTSFFGDSKYDLSTYVRSVLPDEAAAHRVNALDVVENARHLPVWLIHGEADRTSPIAESALLAAALEQRGFSVRFDRIAGVGHSGALVARFLPELVARAATARIPDDIARVSYRSVRPGDLGAYGVRIARQGAHGDAFVDIEKRADGVHVLDAYGVVAIRLERGALTTAARERPPPIRFDEANRSVQAAWAPWP